MLAHVATVAAALAPTVAAVLLGGGVLCRYTAARRAAFLHRLERDAVLAVYADQYADRGAARAGAATSALPLA